MVVLIYNPTHSIIPLHRVEMDSRAKKKLAKELGARIRKVRTSAGISLKHFEAKSAEIDRHALSRIESGQTMPTVYTIFKIAKTLQVPPASLLPDVN